MMKSNYSKALTSGSIIAGGSLGILIPPSTFMVLYGVFAQQHIGKLLIAGLLPGVLLTLLYILTVVIYVKINPNAAEKGEAHPGQNDLKVYQVLYPLLFYLLLLLEDFSLVYSDQRKLQVWEPLELPLLLLLKENSPKVIVEVLEKTLKIVGTLFGILLSALLLNSFIVHLVCQPISIIF